MDPDLRWQNVAWLGWSAGCVARRGWVDRWRIQPGAPVGHNQHHLARRRSRKLHAESGDEARGFRSQWRNSVSKPQCAAPAATDPRGSPGANDGGAKTAHATE